MIGTVYDFVVPGKKGRKKFCLLQRKSITYSKCSK